MWRTQRGDQVLKGAEWDLFAEGLGCLHDFIEMTVDAPDDSLTGIRVFDQLQPPQMLVMLALVGRALRDEEAPAPDLTALTEGTVAAVYRYIRNGIESEVDYSREPDSPGEASEAECAGGSWRRLALAAYRQVEAEEGSPGAPGCDPAGVKPSATAAGGRGPDEDEDSGPWEPPDPSSEDMEAWEDLLEDVSGRVLWDDHDYLAGDLFLDCDPGLAAYNRRMMGIADEYFTDIAPDPADAELAGVQAELRRICGRPEPAERGRRLELEGLHDTYHRLLVGPCDEASVGAELDCKLIEAMGVIVGPDDPGDPGDFDCTYAEWYLIFRDEVRRVALIEPREWQPIAPPPTQAQLAEAGRARRAGSPMDLDEGHRIMPLRGYWFIADEGGLLLGSPDGECWSYLDEDDEEAIGIAEEEAGEDVAAIRFDCPERALAFYLAARAMYEANGARQKIALERLGRSRSSDGVPPTGGS